MTRKYITLTVIFFLFVVSFQAGCSEEKTTINKDILLNEPRMPGKATQQRNTPTREEVLTLQQQDERERKTHVRSAEECQKEFTLCIETCRKPECEDACLKFLATCEKELPKELQTLKK